MNGKISYFLKELEKACYGILKKTNTGEIDLYDLTVQLKGILMLCTLAMKETDIKDDGGTHIFRKGCKKSQALWAMAATDSPNRP